jgi:hypothetical protein
MDNKKQYEGKTVAQLKAELDSFEDQNMIVMLNVNRDKNSRPLIGLARIFVDGIHYAKLVSDEDQVLTQEY